MSKNPTWDLDDVTSQDAINVLLCLQVQEVVGVMRNNIDKVLERDSKLNDLDYRQTDLELRFRI